MLQRLTRHAREGAGPRGEPLNPGRKGNRMNDKVSVEKAKAFFDSYFADGAVARPRVRVRKLPAATISRQAGSGGLIVAKLLADRLSAGSSKPGVAWTVFDKNLMEFAMDDMRLPSRLSTALPENKVSSVADAIEELFGLHPSSWTMVQKVSETILHLAMLGGVILLGRGSAVVTANLEHVFHVRVVGSLERRVDRIMKAFELSRRAALHLIERDDKGRARYLKKNFGAEVDDPLLYDLTINTDRIDLPAAAGLIADYVRQHYY